ncbi:hypothetical protein BDF20DRAFT_888696 [Mycotypha africana]|uniref:uncharacterized protein n=1 Tax=Mycotypha africana TaxID=64632 RepID=UPI0023001E0F|nr:uncharacterized protein BDF20DRAFT_888696 [Mycotypha africana]KAI8969967.1 hypothetical protein BDF20DRAFT_888696 [Mycotypha africana]
MNNARNCMSINALVDHNDTTTMSSSSSATAATAAAAAAATTINDLPLTPPSSCKSRSPTPSSTERDDIQYDTRERRSSLQLPMSVEERRYRNKLASAKYRAKKQASMKSMANKVSQLMNSNTTLQKELSRVKQENEILRAMLLTQQTATNIASGTVRSSSASTPLHYHRPTAAFF